jgi:integrase
VAKKKRGRRGNGEGSIYWRGDGRWVGQYTVETPHGVSKRKTVYGKTRAEAAVKLQEAMARRESEVAEAERKELERRQKTVSAHVEDYLADVARRVRPKTHRRYEDLYHCHIECTEVGEKKLRALTPDDVRALYADRLASGYAPRTVEHLHVFLKGAIQQVVADGLAPRNPVASVKPPRGSKKDIRPLTPGQVRRL